MRFDPAFVDVGTSWETGKPEIEIDVDRDRAADLGVPATVIGRTIRTLLAGEKLGAFEEDGERYDVRVQVLPEYRDTPAKLDLIQIRTASGQLTPITNVADIRLGEGAVRISRQNRSREITIAANAAEGTAQSELAARVEEYGRQIGLAPPNQLVPSGMTVVMRETGLSLLFAFVLAIAAIYMVLASLFNSLVHPITIMMSAPLSLHRRLPGPQARGQAARHDERHRPPRPDGSGHEERDPADRLHQPAPSGRPLTKASPFSKPGRPACVRS